MRFLLLGIVMLAVLIGAHKAEAASSAKIVGTYAAVAGHNASG